LVVQLVDVHLAGGLEAVSLTVEHGADEGDVEEVSLDCEIFDCCRLFILFGTKFEQIRLRE
jgi:hypothetical protein